MLIDMNSTGRSRRPAIGSARNMPVTGDDGCIISDDAVGRSKASLTDQPDDRGIGTDANVNNDVYVVVDRQPTDRGSVHAQPRPGCEVR